VGASRYRPNRLVDFIPGLVTEPFELLGPPAQPRHVVRFVFAGAEMLAPSLAFDRVDLLSHWLLGQSVRQAITRRGRIDGCSYEWFGLKVVAESVDADAPVPHHLGVLRGFQLVPRCYFRSSGLSPPSRSLRPVIGNHRFRMQPVELGQLVL
jgi:hypothetical protein